LEHLEQYQEAIEEFDIVLATIENDKFALERLSMIYLELEMWKESLPISKRLLGIAKNHPGYLNNYGKALVELSRFEEAVKVFDRASRLDKNDMRGFANLGNALQQVGRYTQAEAAYRRGLKIKPDNTVLLGAMITLLKKMGKTRKLDEFIIRHQKASVKAVEEYQEDASDQESDENWT
jgi:tetratricopeptide (TPR) repeat protein